MRKYNVLIGALAAIAMLQITGCATVSSRPQPLEDSGHVSQVEDETTKGFRYYLPKPYILVTPTVGEKAEEGDGTEEIAVSVGSEDVKWTATTVSLPDYQRGYYAKSQSLFATQTFSISVENGLLKAVTAHADTSGVPNDALKAGGAVAAQEEEEETSTIDQATAELEKVKQLIALLNEIKNGGTPAEQDQVEKAIENLEAQRNEMVQFYGNPPVVDTKLLQPALFEVQAERDGQLTLKRVPIVTTQDAPGH